MEVELAVSLLLLQLDGEHVLQISHPRATVLTAQEKQINSYIKNSLRYAKRYPIYVLSKGEYTADIVRNFDLLIKSLSIQF